MAIGPECAAPTATLAGFARPRLLEHERREAECHRRGYGQCPEHTAPIESAITKLPIPGARIGETLITSMSIDISLVASCPVWRSRTIARGTTIPAQAPNA